MKLTHTQAVWGMVAVAAMWSIAGVVTRQLESAARFEVTFWRSLFTMLSLLVILPLWKGRDALSKLPWRNRLFWISGLCWSVMFTAFMVALTMTTVANVLITLALGPFITALMARVFTGHALPGRTWLAIVVAGCGIGWMFGAQFSLGGSQAMTGFLVALCVPIAGATQWTLVQHSHGNGQPTDLVSTVLLGAMLSTAFMLPWAMPFVASGSDIAWLALLGLVQLAIPCTLSVVCARVLKAPEVALLALLEVLFGIGLAWLGAGEEPGGTVLAGGALVVGALVMNELLGWRQRNG